MLTRAAGWLMPTGRLIADLDLSAIKLSGGPAATRRLAGPGYTGQPAVCSYYSEDR